MPLYTNTTQGTVAYTTSEFTTKLIVPNDVDLISTDVFQSLLKLDLGKNERAAFRIWLDLALDADGDFKYKITTPANTVSFRGKHVLSENPISNPVTETISFIDNTPGLSTTTIIGNDGNAYVQFDGTVTNGSTNGSVDIQVAQQTSSPTASTVKFGSYFEYLKF